MLMLSVRSPISYNMISYVYIYTHHIILSITIYTVYIIIAEALPHRTPSARVLPVRCDACCQPGHLHGLQPGSWLAKEFQSGLLGSYG